MSPALLPSPTAIEPVFSFDEESHTYWIGDRFLPSITQILDEQGLIDKEHFKEEHRYRGQYVHWCIRLLNEGRLRREDIDPKYVGYVDGYFKAMSDFKIVPVLFEQPMWHPDMFFAGTPDIITADAIWELKTGEIYPWVAQQTIAQELLYRAREARPKRRKRYGLRLNKNGTYDRPVEFKNWLQDETVFKINVAAVLNKPLYGAPMLRGLTPCKK